MKKLSKYIFLFWFGGSFYVTLEVFFREHSHWSMFLLAGIVFLTVDALNEIWVWQTNLIVQIITGSIIATLYEFITGYIVNIQLNLNIWDYSEQWGNLMGQICPLFSLIWVPLITMAIFLSDTIRWKFFNEECPRYWIFGFFWNWGK